MVKRALSLFIIVVMLLTFTKPVFAHDADEHDAIIEAVLFGGENYSSDKSAEITNRITMLKYASYLAIDQFNGNGVKKLEFLSEQGVSSLPSDISEIDFSGNSTHRSYTHRGWDFIYPDDKANWSVRKDILRSTVNKVFDFGFIESANVFGFNIKEKVFHSYSDKCNSFSALVYYVHILGDHIAAKSYKATDLIIPFVRANASEDNPDIVYELKKHLNVIFEDQKDGRTYKALMLEIDSIASKSKSIVRTTGGVNTEQEFNQYKEYEEEFMKVLKAYIPLLLQKEDFFKEVFPIQS